jgi:NAD(P)-dependent dehydrogenase (short-subunit alcohol dehydrogenase family)
MKLQDKVVVVTGAGSGMGRELTIELVRRGAKVAAVDIHEQALSETQVLAGGTVAIFTLDVTDRLGVAGLPAQIEAEIGAVDVLINNAGIIQPFIKINELTFEQADFYGPFSMIKAFLPGLLTRPQAHILNVSSMGAYAPVPGQSVYGASKAAVKLLTEGLRSELMGTNVGVTIVFPGAVATNITTNSGIEIPEISADAPAFKQTAAPVAARMMADAIEKNKPRITVGKDATMMDRISRVNPVFAANLIYKQMKSLLG